MQIGPGGCPGGVRIFEPVESDDPVGIQENSPAGNTGEFEGEAVRETEFDGVIVGEGQFVDAEYESGHDFSGGHIGGHAGRNLAEAVDGACADAVVLDSCCGDVVPAVDPLDHQPVVAGRQAGDAKLAAAVAGIPGQPGDLNVRIRVHDGAHMGGGHRDHVPIVHMALDRARLQHEGQVIGRCIGRLGIESGDPGRVVEFQGAAKPVVLGI